MTSKIVLFNLIFDAVYVACVTMASIYFENYNLLWWYLLVLVTGYSVKNRKDNNNGESIKTLSVL